MIFNRPSSLALIGNVSIYRSVATATLPMGTFLSSYQGDILMEFQHRNGPVDRISFLGCNRLTVSHTQKNTKASL